MSLEDFEYFACPYCGQENQLPIDLTGGSSQQFVVDCEVCCAPIVVRLKLAGGQVKSLDVSRENE